MQTLLEYSILISGRSNRLESRLLSSKLISQLPIILEKQNTCKLVQASQARTTFVAHD